MKNDLIYAKMQQLEAEYFGSTFDDIFQKLPEGPLQNETDALYKYVLLQQQLIHNLENEVAELRDPKPERFFYPLTARSKPVRL